jgi:surfactin synthase thioesterase subunit
MSRTSLRDPWIVRPRPNARPRVRLFCFPFAGGGASTYRSWPAHLPADIEVIAVQLPGREERLREPPFRDAMEHCRTLVDVLAPYLDRPFAFFGHSMGALVAFELVRTLVAAGGPSPAYLFVSAHCGPRVPHCLPSVSGLSDRDLVSLLRRLGGTPAEVLEDGDVMRLMLPLFRADLTICETYRYELDAKLSCPISAFGGTLDDFIRRPDLLAWSGETRGAFQARMLPGGHFFIDDAKPRLLQAVAEDLAGLGAPEQVSTPMSQGDSAP